ncbi:MAG: protein-L-isoaspartate O-methyltransferase [Sphingomicrobium sp.]
MTIHAPVPNYAAARRLMVESQLRPQGVTDAGVLEAMGAVERETFAPAEARALAYADRSLALGGGRYLCAPAAIAQLLTQLAPVPGERALVVGAATGYSAALLARVGLNVTAVESDPGLAAQARALGIAVVEGNLDRGHKAEAPYELILIDGAIEHVPAAIVDQLADGGRLGTALIERGITRLIVGRKTGGAFGYLSINDAGVPALPGFSRPPTFTF